jgi:hypothetical protein
MNKNQEQEKGSTVMEPEVRVRIRVVGVETTSPLFDDVERIAYDAWEKVDRLIRSKN